MVERLPTPWGLVRLGVAPDHPEIKAVSRVFEKTAKEPGFRFFGNVDIGRDVSPEELASLYDAVVYAVGAQTDRRMGIPGEDLPGSWPATEFVAWYNGHPDYQQHEFDLSGERAIVVGNGNVAVDVARMLSLTHEELSPTDTTFAAHEAIVESGLKEIVMLGRRGPAQAAFTNPELKELGELDGADVIVDPADLVLDAASEAMLAEERSTARRNIDLLREYSRARTGGQAAPADPALPRLAGRDSRRRQGRSRRGRPEHARRRRERPASRGRDRGARGDPVRHRPAERRLPRRRASRRPVRRGSRRDPERRRPRSRARRRADPGDVRLGLDQARPERRDRHEQERRRRDRRASARGRRRRASSRRRGRSSRSS